MALATAPHSQPRLTIQAIHPFVIGVCAFALHQGMQSTLAEAATLVRQFNPMICCSVKRFFMFVFLSENELY